MKNLARLLVATLIASSLLVGCGSKDEEDFETTERVERVEKEDKPAVEEKEEPEVEEEETEEPEKKEGTELEDYFAEHPDEYAELQAQGAQNSNDEMTCEISVEGNTVVYTFTLLQSYTSSEREQIASALESEFEGLDSLYGTVNNLYSVAVSAKVTSELRFIDVDGNEILTISYE